MRVSMTTTPKHPTENMSLPDGLYEATIANITHGEYAGESHYLRITLWLPEQQSQFVTMLYLPHRYSNQANQRMWHFCKVVGLESHDLFDEPEAFEGRKLRISIRKYQHDNGLTLKSYSDVKAFLPFGTDAERNRELGMPMVPHSGLRE